MPVPANILREQRSLANARELTSGQEHFYRIWQSFLSPYSHKVMSYMNYKEIPYKRMYATMEVMMGEINERVGYPVIPVVLTPDNQVLQDSTPMLEWFESQHPAKSAIPEDGRLAFLMWLLEEFADEYMRRLHMHTRWGNDMNRSAISNRLARYLSFARADMAPADIAPFILERQSGFNLLLGLTTEAAHENVGQQLLDLLAIFEEHFEHYQFVLGFRPSLADFALFGSMRGHMFNDPQSSAILEVNAPRTCRWLDTIADFGDPRGCAGQTVFGDWIDFEEGLPETLVRLLTFVGKTYIPLAKASARASAEQAETFEVEIYGETATFSVHEYRAWSFEQLQNRYLTLTGADKDELDQLLVETDVIPSMMEAGIVHSDLYDGLTPPVVKAAVANTRIRHQKEQAARQET